MIGMASAFGRVTVFGGSGFLGRQIVRRLADDGADVRVAVRRPERAAFLTEAGKPGQVTTVHADVWDEASVGSALVGSEAVVKTVGHYVERGRATFEAIHGHAALHVARAAAEAGSRAQDLLRAPPLGQPHTRSGQGWLSMSLRNAASKEGLRMPLRRLNGSRDTRAPHKP